MMYTPKLMDNNAEPMKASLIVSGLPFILYTRYGQREKLYFH